MLNVLSHFASNFFVFLWNLADNVQKEYHETVNKQRIKNAKTAS